MNLSSKKIISVFASFLFLFSCNHPEEKKEVKEIYPVRHFIKKLDMLPADTYTLSFESPENTKLYDRDDNDIDTIYFQGPCQVLGYLPDTSKFFSVLYYEAVSAGALSIVNIGKDGQLIDSEMLGTDLYGCGCGYYWHGKIYVNKDRTFLMRDSLITYNCDSIGPLPEKYWKHEIGKRSAKILQDGKIEMSKLEMKTVKEPEHVQSPN